MVWYIKQFQDYWTHTASQLDLTVSSCEELYGALCSAYSESQRHYHTVQHIVECLEHFHDIKTHLTDALSVELAIWFHDVIYNPQANDNEQQSADYMKQVLESVLVAEQMEKIYAWILATQAHAPTAHLDLAYLLDIDLAILASNPIRFAEYERQIQQEYAWVEPPLYAQKRQQVLRHFLEIQPLYQTPLFQKRYEHQAKQNLAQILSV
ncbi:metal-dependent hydrolase [Acinetobacter sp. WCHAc060042]|uniref:HD domain-containing protein n=1 Tax=Acinetobacter sp. WCHAc060042 TaxID=2213016 RepID=UPI000DA66A70|nr:metal-dependent hydrolase [Acinetobacter sp. WCHAc060042]